MSYESLLREVGGFGRWQLLSALLLSAGAFYCGMAFLVYPFAFATPAQHRCFVPKCDGGVGGDDVDGHAAVNASWVGAFIPTKDGKLSSCEVSLDPQDGSCSGDRLPGWDQSQTRECDQWVFDDSVYQSTAVTEYGLVCSRNHLKSAVGSANVVVYGLGSVFAGWFSDRFGRKPLLLLSILAGCTFNMLTSFSNSYAMHFVFYMAAGLFLNGTYQPAVTLLVELVSHRYAGLMSVILNFPFVAGELYMVLAAYLFRDYRDMIRFAFGTSYLLLIVGFFFPESPRWLIAKKKYESAAEVLSKGARLNKKNISQDQVLALINEASVEVESSGQKERETDLSVWDICKSSVLRQRLASMCLNWVAVVLCYNGLSLNSVNLGGDVYVSVALGALIEAPSYLFCLLAFDRLGRFPTLMLSYALTVVSCVVVLAAPAAWGAWVAVTMATIAKFGCTVAFTVVILMTVELFPTSVRIKAIGVCSLSSRLGAFLAPVVTNLGPGLWWVPWSVFLASSALGALVSLPLPETANRELPMTIADAEAASNKDNKDGAIRLKFWDKSDHSPATV